MNIDSLPVGTGTIAITLSNYNFLTVLKVQKVLSESNFFLGPVFIKLSVFGYMYYFCTAVCASLQPNRYKTRACFRFARMCLHDKHKILQNFPIHY